MSFQGRLAAGIVAAAAAAGLITQYDATLAVQGTAGSTLWILARFFTVLTNLMVAILFGAVACNARRLATPSRVGGAVASIVLVGIVYAVLLRGLMELSGGAVLANILMHQVTPVLAPLWWLAFGRERRLRPRDPWLWTLWPLTYLVYALLRGTWERKFAYPFLDYVAHGWGSVLVNGVGMAGGFILLGYVMLWIDWRPKRSF